MKSNNEAKHITSLDVAKVLGVEKEYREALFEQELKKNYETVMSDVFVHEKNNSIDNDNDT